MLLKSKTFRSSSAKMQQEDHCKRCLETLRCTPIFLTSALLSSAICMTCYDILNVEEPFSLEFASGTVLWPKYFDHLARYHYNYNDIGDALAKLEHMRKDRDKCLALVFSGQCLAISTCTLAFLSYQVKQPAVTRVFAFISYLICGYWACGGSAIPLALSGYWLALTLGFVAVMESPTSWWACIFSLTITYACSVQLVCRDAVMILYHNTHENFNIFQYTSITSGHLGKYEFLIREGWLEKLKTVWLVAVCIFCVGLAHYLVQIGCMLYVNLWNKWTFKMKTFLVIDVLSMITFSVYCVSLPALVAKQVALVCLCIGWILSLCFMFDFSRPTDLDSPETKQKQLDERLQRAGKIGVFMDVGGKVITYFFVLKGVEPHLNKWLVALEFLTTLAEAMEKHVHACRVHAREVPRGGRLTRFLLADQEP